MNQRFYSLDVFRGATVALMILVNNPGSWAHIYAPLDHASWHGCTPTDLVFPFFLFAVGNAMAFVMPKLAVAGEAAFWKKTITRTILIFLIGLFLNWFPFCFYEHNILTVKTWGHAGITAQGQIVGVRIFGVLQRIALSYFFASVIVHFFKVRGSFIAGAFILLFYWFLCVAANPADPFSITGWFGTAVDKAILGEIHMYHGEGIAFDPEGLMNTFAAIVQVVMGYLIGNYIVQKGKTPEMLNGLFVAACVLILTGFCWDMVFPINKKIWTSSYTVYTTGLATLILSVMIYLIEFKNRKGVWSRFFDVFGKNALFIFALSNLILKTSLIIHLPNGFDKEGLPKTTHPLGWFYEHLCKPVFPAQPNIGSLIYALCFITMMWFFAWLLDRKKIYIRV
ncbi:acyltransferase family protein [Ferruginibacter sp. SUN106]|uniref:acyltransferase family protein n=1 Tax=Ferruginibacter sp. SUN106 TaxID=2978348 RepID=UPI003D364581